MPRNSCWPNVGLSIPLWRIDRSGQYEYQYVIVIRMILEAAYLTVPFLIVTYGRPLLFRALCGAARAVA